MKRTFAALGAAFEGTHRWVRCTGLVAGLALGGCGGGGVIQAQHELPPPPPGTGFVKITCLPKTADIYVDGRYKGRLDGYPRGVLRLTAGQHRIKLAQRGYSPQYALVEVGPQASRIRTWLVPSVDAPPQHRLAE